VFGMSFFEWFRFFRISSFLHGEKALPLLAVRECGTVLCMVDCEGRQSAASGACGASLSDCPAPACFVDGGLLGARSALDVLGASCGVVGLGRSTAKPGWSLRRSGIQGALPFRGGAGDFLEIRLAGTPAGRFAAFT